MFRYIFQDWRANYGNPKGQIVLMLFRLASWFSIKCKKPFVYVVYPYIIFYRIFVEWLMGIELPWHLKLGASARLFHGQSLVVNDRAVIGKGVVLRHCTTIGVSRTDIDNMLGGAPVIGDFVDIGSNAIIIGDISIGDNSIIGAGSVVIKDVPKNSIVVGNPARVVGVVGS